MPQMALFLPSFLALVASIDAFMLPPPPFGHHTPPHRHHPRHFGDRAPRVQLPSGEVVKAHLVPLLLNNGTWALFQRGENATVPAPGGFLFQSAMWARLLRSMHRPPPPHMPFPHFPRPPHFPSLMRPMQLPPLLGGGNAPRRIGGIGGLLGGLGGFGIGGGGDGEAGPGKLVELKITRGIELDDSSSSESGGSSSSGSSEEQKLLDAAGEDGEAGGVLEEVDVVEPVDAAIAVDGGGPQPAPVVDVVEEGLAGIEEPADLPTGEPGKGNEEDNKGEKAEEPKVEGEKKKEDNGDEKARKDDASGGNQEGPVNVGMSVNEETHGIADEEHGHHEKEVAEPPPKEGDEQKKIEEKKEEEARKGEEEGKKGESELELPPNFH